MMTGNQVADLWTQVWAPRLALAGGLWMLYYAPSPCSVGSLNSWSKSQLSAVHSSLKDHHAHA